MVKWEALSRPKESGGLGFMDVRAMNVCLLSKWIDKLERGDESMCCELLRKKYLGQKSIFQIKTQSGSQFWRGLLEARDWFKMGRSVKVKSVCQTDFWNDCWLGRCPLRIECAKLFAICADPTISVAKMCERGAWDIRFRRTLYPEEIEEWLELQSRLSGFSMTEGRDELVWDLERSGRFTIRSLYYLMTFGGVRDQRMLDVWAAKLPLKTKIFLWMVFHDRIQSAE